MKERTGRAAIAFGPNVLVVSMKSRDKIPGTVHRLPTAEKMEQVVRDPSRQGYVRCMDAENMCRHEESTTRVLCASLAIWPSHASNAPHMEETMSTQSVLHVQLISPTHAIDATRPISSMVHHICAH